ncbi:hypothetical protein [Amycolatopsis keratiniphila]|uniref:Uncharacterized protein n=1 Tax=Amycolatopsis keratiniphila subsp. keratiniphila TaxID=227715 RepID=A0A1W2M249_9PSEU|nr:hypothetical protein [Amycolatopsis keratiniphila]ONF73972.1 hypothetical protein AVR91_0204375 [Amycolatopsis keratiniphila subsp. keratiniphila]
MSERFTAQNLLGDNVAVSLVAQANAARDEASTKESAAARPRRRRIPRVDPWERTAFNSKVPRWVRSAARAFADEEDQDLQDLHAAGLVLLMSARGFDVESFMPETGPKDPEKTSALVELLGSLKQSENAG